MADAYRAVIPYESLDPLTIGASGDDEKVSRETLELEIPQANLLAAIYPDEPDPVADATEAARAALESPVAGPRFSEVLSREAPPRDRDRQPVPADAAVEAAAARVRRGRGGRHRGGRRLCERQGLPDVGVGHRAEDRTPEPRADGTARDRVLPERAAQRGHVRLRRRLVARHARLAPPGGRALRREAHDRAGAVEPLGRGRRRQADLPGRRLGRDDRVEPLRVRPVAADALRRLRRADALGHRRGGDHVRPRRDDERDPRHARARARGDLRLAPAGAPARDRALQRHLHLRASGRAGRHRDLRRLRAHRPPLLPHGLGLHVGRLRPPRRRHDHLREPLAGRLDGGRRLPRPGADGPDEAVHAGDARELPARAEGHPRARDPDVGRLHLGARSTR